LTVAVRDLDAAIARASSAVTERAVLGTLDVLMSIPGPPGGERALAERVAEWGRRTYADLEWSIDALDPGSANVVARAAHADGDRTLALYGHLDTSLTGDDRDQPITGERTAPASHRFDGTTREIRGFGVGIARAPSAAAIVVLAAAAEALRSVDVPHRLELLLAAGGTHRAPEASSSRAAPAFAPSLTRARFGRGVHHALAKGWKPDAVLNVKGGPPGVLYEEPATAYLRVVLRSRWTAALVRAKVAPDGGLVRHAGAVLDAIEAWRDSYLAAHPPAGQLASEIVIGAVRGGSPEKADLIPGHLEVSVYAVIGPAEDPDTVAVELATFLRARLAGLPGAPAVAVEAYAFAPGGSTSPSHEIVRLARDAWRAHRGGDAPAVSGWTGATDGATLMAAGIPTVRMGAYVRRDLADPRTEIVSLDELLASARAWTEVVMRYAAGPRAR
jgi:acetylornithine deacetylase/succinyl-diaminopimelate desuccinylase-like protein